NDSFEEALKTADIHFVKIGEVVAEGTLTIKHNRVKMGLNVPSLRDIWYKTSYLLDDKQTSKGLAKDRFTNYKEQPLLYKFPKKFDGTLAALGHPVTERILNNRPKAAILREKGSNSEREMAN